MRTGCVRGGGEHVDDRAPHRHLAPVLDLVLAAVAAPAPGAPTSSAESTRSPGPRTTGSTSSTWGPRRCTSARAGATTTRSGSSPVRRRHSTSQAPTHRLDRRADPLEGQRLPGREQLDRSAGEERRQVGGQPLGLGGGGHAPPPPAAGATAATMPASATARAASGTTRTVEDRPSAPTRPGSSRSAAPSARSGREQRRPGGAGSAGRDGRGAPSARQDPHVPGAVPRPGGRGEAGPMAVLLADLLGGDRSGSATSSAGCRPAGSRPCSPRRWPRSPAWSCSCWGSPSPAARPTGTDLGLGAAAGVRRGPGLSSFYWAMAQRADERRRARLGRHVGGRARGRRGWPAVSPPAPATWLGVAIALPAIVLIAREGPRSRGPRARSRWRSGPRATRPPGPGRGARPSGIGFGLFLVLHHPHQRRQRPVAPGRAPARCACGAARRGRCWRPAAPGARTPTRRTGWPGRRGPRRLANVLFLLASRQGLLTLVGVIGAMYPASTVVLARVVLGERLASATSSAAWGSPPWSSPSSRCDSDGPGVHRGHRRVECRRWPPPRSASAARWTDVRATSRSRPGTFDSTQSAPRSGPAGGLARHRCGPATKSWVCEVRADGAQAVVAREPAARLHLDHARLQVELVVHHHEPRPVLDAVAPHAAGDTARPGLVHVGGGDGQATARPPPSGSSATRPSTLVSARSRSPWRRGQQLRTASAPTLWRVPA